jgi:hypothetical protein
LAICPPLPCTLLFLPSELHLLLLPSLSSYFSLASSGAWQSLPIVK